MVGIIAVYKPKGPSSHDLINQIRQLTGVKRVGHAGTLDPLASGVLVIGIGREATKKLFHIVRKDKEYLATITLGFYSTTDDEEGAKAVVAVRTIPSPKRIHQVLNSFIGQIEQIPPQYSAVNVDGKRAYKLARQGNKLILPSRLVEIKQIKLISFQWPELKLRITTGPGAYIRALARDIGRKLKTGGYISELERTRVGEFTLEKAARVEELGKEVVGCRI